MKHRRFRYIEFAMEYLLVLALLLALSGCGEMIRERGPVSGDPNRVRAVANDPVGPGASRVFELREITPEQGQTFVAELGLGTVAVVPERRAIAVRGTPGDLYRTAVLLDLVDTRETFLIETLGRAGDARTLPSNPQIAGALGDVSIGTFADPPRAGEPTRAIIDIHGPSVIAIIPARMQKDLLAFVEFGAEKARQTTDKPEDVASPETAAGIAQSEEVFSLSIVPDGNDGDLAMRAERETGNAACRVPVRAHSSPAEKMAPDGVTANEKRTPEGGTPPEKKIKNLDQAIPWANGEDVLQLDLPDQVELIQLLDLAAEYLHIDYMYEPEKLRGQSISLRLHGKLQGEIRVKDLYPLLESVLKFKGYAMTCHKDNLVTIVPVADALGADPVLMDPNETGPGAGDMVVTKVFHLQHINALNAMSLLENLRLSVAASPVEETGSLIVTCYAHRMARIERLLEMVDRPGRIKEFRSRRLQHTMAGALTAKIKALVAELQNVPVEIASLEQLASTPGVAVRAPLTPSSTGGLRSLDVPPSDLLTRRAVYLDADEGTNRILMVGDAEQLAIVDEVIDTLDVIQQDLRTFRMYEITHVDAQDVKKQLAEFGLIGSQDEEPKPSRITGAGTGANLDPGAGTETAVPPGMQNLASTPIASQEPQVSVLPLSNSLLVNATEVQHARIARVVQYVDTTARQEAIPYEVYSLENQDPEHLAEVLQKLLQETVVEDKEAKVDPAQPAAGTSPFRRREEQTVIVPDKNTFSLIVYASRKNQEWIRKLVRTLDKRRPQVLIDATLVEIRKNDEFNYDLEMVAGLPDLRVTGGQTGQFLVDDDTTVTDRLQQTGRDHIIDFQAKSGQGIGFYADEHIQALLTAVQTKNYGRVLAKPKVLVNDNEKGNIKTADTTYVVTKSSVPVAGGTAGQQNQLIETALGYEPYEAGITLEITPHISDGNLLRLEIALTRSDFTSNSTEKPPNQTSSNVGTVVTVPDGSTIILGGMLKLNQTKGGNKIPLLGDLPLVGGLFRSVNRNDIQSMLYIFVRAEIIRPAETGSNSYEDLRRISDENRKAFEQHENEFQDYRTWPGVKSKPMAPGKVLETR